MTELVLDQPFTTTPNPRYFYLAPQYRTVLNHVIGTIVEKKGLAIVAGPVGCGKSTMFRFVVDWLAEKLGETAHVAYLNNPSYTTDFQLLKAVCAGYGIASRPRRDEQMEALKTWLAEKSLAGDVVVLLVDEAHRLIGPQFELIRELFNFAHNERGFYIQVVLAGEDGPLCNKLKNKQAVVSRALYYDLMAPLGLEDVADLIHFRLRVSGIDENVFTPEAISKIHELSRGIPRDVIKLCYRAYGARTGRQRVTAADVTAPRAPKKSYV